MTTHDQWRAAALALREHAARFDALADDAMVTGYALIGTRCTYRSGDRMRSHIFTRSGVNHDGHVKCVPIYVKA